MRFFKIAPALATSLAAALLLTGCGIFEDDEEEPRIQGERISILDAENEIAPDRELAAREVRLPRPYVNLHWPQPGGAPGHAMYHLALPEGLGTAWRVDIGAGNDDDRPLLAQPVVAGEVVFTMDSDNTVRAFRTSSGRLLWARPLRPQDEEDGVFGGGLAIAGERVFATTGAGAVYGLNARTGEIAWRHNADAPIRSGPAVHGEGVYAVTVVNETIALSQADGALQWSHQGIEEQAGLLGSATPAVSDDSVVTAYSSGEVFGLLRDNGRMLWSDNLGGVAGSSGRVQMADIRGLPVIDRDRVFAVSNAQRMVAIDRRRGARVWENELSSAETPWIGGDFIYVVTPTARVVAVARDTGKIRWATQIARFDDPEDREDPIRWQAPVLAGDRLILAGSHGLAVALSPYTGDFLGRLELPDGAAVPPVVANETLYVLTNDGSLIALR